MTTLLQELRAKCPELIASRNEVAMAAVLSVGRTKVVPCQIGIGTVLATLGSSGGQFLDGMVALGASDRNVYWAMKLLEGSILDIGMQATRTQMQALADANPGIAPAIAALLALAVEPNPVSAFEVAVALEGV